MEGPHGHSSGDGSRGTCQPDLGKRTYAFALRIIKLTRALPQDTASTAISRQLARSGTGIGANVEEAQGAHSRVDYARRMNNARGEARETYYWLRLLRDSKTLPASRLAPIINESEQLLKILVATVKRLKEK